jgi:diguanylate cyclase (GGDEF)-like protein
VPIDILTVQSRFFPAIRLRLTRSARRLVGIGVFAIAVIGAAVAWMISEQRDAALADAWKAGSNLAQVLAEQTSRTLQPVDLTLREIADRLGADQADPASGGWADQSTHDLLVQKLKFLPQIAALMVADASGHMMSNSRDFPSKPVELAGREYFKYFQTRDDPGVFISAPATSYVRGVWSIFLVHRINRRNGEFAGIIAARLTLDYLEDFYRAAMPPNWAVTLLERDGTIIARYPPVEGQIGAKLSLTAPWYRLVSEGGGSYRSPGYIDGRPTLVSVRPMHDFPLVIDAGVLEPTALADWRRQTRMLLAGAVCAAVLVVLLLRVFGKQIARLEQSEAALAGQNAALETSRLQFHAALENVSHGIAFYDGDARMVVCNRRYGEIYRLSPDHTLPGTPFSDIVKYREEAGTLVVLTSEAYLARREAAHRDAVPFDITDELQDGRAILMRYQPMPDGGWVATHEDITERQRAAQGLAFLAHHDALTELPNRALFQERLSEAIAMTRTGVHCALLCLDLDRFKVINDTLGHPTGDELLCAVAGRLSSIIREADTVARLGGDEFAIVQTGLTSAKQAAQIADRIIAAVRQPYDIGGHRIAVGVSIGIAMTPADGTTPETLLKKADIALYLAKAEGRGTWRFFQPEMDARAQELRLVEMDLRNASPTEDFALHYQPIIDVRSGRVTGFEALIRWNHPHRGLVSPADFILLAEETGLIMPIGEWALQAACAAAAKWPEDVDVAVNISPVQFNDGRLADVVQEVLAASGLAPGRLVMEVTESVLLQNSADRLAVLHRLREMGIRIALDDFGTGYSSLSYLRSFPFDKIKIDQSFIRDLGSNRDSMVIVEAVIGLARGLGMTTVAEGVETAQQLATLADAGCTRVQGYLFSRPVPEDEVAGLIATLSQARPSLTGSERTAPARALKAVGSVT